MKNCISIILFILISTSILSAQKLDKTLDHNPVDFVNPFIGTGGEGHTYPGATVPFGMVQLSPDTDVKSYHKSFAWCAGYQYGDSSIVGFSHTHFSGTGHSDMGDILVMPTVGKIKLNAGSKENPDEGYRSRYSHENEAAKPGYYQVLLEDYNINVELTASARTGFHKYTFPKSDESHILMDLTKSIYNYDGKVLWSEIRIENDTLITGYRQTSGWAYNRTVYFAITLSKPIKSYTLYNEEDIVYRGFKRRQNEWNNYPHIEGKKLKAILNFSTNEGEEVKMKVSISGVDINGALTNLRTEIPHWDFNQTKKQANGLWAKELSKIKVNGDKDEMEIFYTSSYHTMLAPVLYEDVDGRYRGIDHAVHESENFDNYTIWSLWDTYRATHPLFTITQPKRVGSMVNSMLAHQEQSVHNVLPVWAFHANETWCMIGYHSVSIIADACLKDIDGFDYQKALKAVVTSATYSHYDGLNHYMKLGYVPIDKENEGASKTLEYAYDDWTISEMAKKLGNIEIAETFSKRALNYQNIYDKSSGFMRAKKSDGSFRAPFDPFFAQYGGDYTEGNAWQYSWYVPQDPQGLINLMGGDKNFVSRLDSLFMLDPNEDSFKHVEDIAGLIGMYAHGNEPSQHITYLYNYAGQPWRTQERINQVMNNLFDNTPYGICGNEDCGQMSAWYMFSSMGFYPVAPGSLEYIIGKPCLNDVVINLDNGNKFNIKTSKLSDKNIYIRSVKLNGVKLNRSFIHHNEIMDGGLLEFEMGSRPNKKWATNLENRPYSMSK